MDDAESVALCTTFSQTVKSLILRVDPVQKKLTFQLLHFGRAFIKYNTGGAMSWKEKERIRCPMDTW